MHSVSNHTMRAECFVAYSTVYSGTKCKATQMLNDDDDQSAPK